MKIKAFESTANFFTSWCLFETRPHIIGIHNECWIFYCLQWNNKFLIIFSSKQHLWCDFGGEMRTTVNYVTSCVCTCRYDEKFMVCRNAFIKFSSYFASIKRNSNAKINSKAPQWVRYCEAILGINSPIVLSSIMLSCMSLALRMDHIGNYIIKWRTLGELESKGEMKWIRFSFETLLCLRIPIKYCWEWENEKLWSFHNKKRLSLKEKNSSISFLLQLKAGEDRTAA